MVDAAHCNLGSLDDLVDGEIRAVAGPNDHGVVVCNVAGIIYAIEDNCGHADAPLSHGRLRGWHLTCPLHNASFDIRDGSHSGPPARRNVPCYRVERIDGEVWVTVA